MVAEIDRTLMQPFHDGQYLARRAGCNQQPTPATPGFHNLGIEGAHGAVGMPLRFLEGHACLDAPRYMPQIANSALDFPASNSIHPATPAVILLSTVIEGLRKRAPAAAAAEA